MENQQRNGKDVEMTIIMEPPLLFPVTKVIH